MIYVNGVAEVGSKVIWKDESEQAVSDIARSTDLDWTELDLTAYVSANAKYVILQVQHYVISISAGGKALEYIRKNGTTPQWSPYLMTDSAKGDAAGADKAIHFILALDADKKIQYTIEITGTISLNTFITVLGYIE